MLKTIVFGYPLLILLAVNPLPLVAQEANQAELINYSGGVSVFLKDADSVSEPEEGMLLEAGDKITTSDGATAALSFNTDNSNVVRLGERTSAALLLEDEEKLEITEGEAFASVSSLPSGSSFEIRTPTAVSGARGTDWVTTVTNEGTDVEAVDSVPYVRHFENSGRLSDQRTLIQPGQATTVQKFRPPLPPRPMVPGRQSQWNSVKLQVHNRAQEAIVKRMNRPAFDRKQFLQQKQNKGNADGFKPLVSREGERRQENISGMQDKPRRPENRPGAQNNENRPQPKLNNELRRPRNGK